MHITETTPTGTQRLSQLPLVLLVDDDPADARLVREALREREVHVRLMTARDAAQAFGALRLVPTNSLPRLIICDLGLPGIRGTFVLREFAAHAGWNAVPKVMLTSSEREFDRAEALAFGAAAYFVKPRDLDGYLRLADELKKFL
jgi:CheY-like chemotaxis protein